MADRYYYVLTKDGKKFFYSRESGQKVPRKNIDVRIIPNIKTRPEKDIKDANAKKAVSLIERKEALQQKLRKINVELAGLDIHTKKDEQDIKKYWEEHKDDSKNSKNDNKNNNKGYNKDNTLDDDEDDTTASKAKTPSDKRDDFDYQQFATNYNNKTNENTTAEYWREQFSSPKIGADSIKKRYSTPKPDTSYSNTHQKSSYTPKPDTPDTPHYNAYTPKPSSPYSTPHHNAYASYKNYNNTNASSTTSKNTPPLSPEMSNPASQCTSSYNFPSNTLVSRNIITKDDWKQWLKKNHTDKGGDATICGYVIAAGRSKGW